MNPVLLLAGAVAVMVAGCAGNVERPSAVGESTTSPPAASATTSGSGDGITREEADAQDVRHGGYAVSVTGPPRVAADAGDTTEVEYLVTNRGDHPDRYAVVATGARGSYPVTPAEVSVAAGEAVRVTMRVTPPADATGGYDTITVVARSRADGGVEDEASTVVHAA